MWQLFNTPLLFNVPDERSPKNICSVFGVHRLQVQSSANCMMMSSDVSTQYTRMSDGWTYTARQHIPRYEYASRGKNVFQKIYNCTPITEKNCCILYVAFSGSSRLRSLSPVAHHEDSSHIQLWSFLSTLWRELSQNQVPVVNSS